MLDRQIKLSTQSNILRIKLRHSTTQQGLTGLASDTSGLIISTICDNEAVAVAYTATAETIETIATLGTFATPTATKCRFKEVDATNHPGVYELQLANARFAVASSKILQIAILGAANLLECDYNIELVGYDPIAGTIRLADGVHGGAASVITFKKLVGANSDAGESVIDLAATGTGNSHGIKVNATNGKALALGSTNNDGVSIDSGAAKGLNINGATADIDADILGDITGDLSGAVGSVTGSVTIAAGQLFVKKNTQLANFTFPIFAASDHVTPLTGVTVTATRSIDGGAFAPCANAVSEIGSSGVYKITLAAADLNGTNIILQFTGEDADPTIIGLITQA
jgi:hypothetical protein